MVVWALNLTARTNQASKFGLYGEIIMRLVKFKIEDDVEYLAEDSVNGYLINPLLIGGKIPKKPFIIRNEHEFSVYGSIEGFLRFWGTFKSLDDALACAKYKSICYKLLDDDL